MSFTAFIRPLIKVVNIAIAATPFVNSQRDMEPRSLHIPPMMPKATDTDNNNPVNFAVCCLLPILVVLTSKATNPAKASANIPPLIISGTDNKLISFTTPTIRAMAILIFSIIPPTLLTLFPALLATLVIAITKPPNAKAKAVAFTASSKFIVPDNFTTPIIRSIENANLLIIFPTLSAFLPRSPFVKKLMAAATPNNPSAIAATPRRPCIISSRFIPPTILAAIATIRIAAAIFARLIFSPLILPPNPFSFLLNSIDVSDNFDIAIERPVIIATNPRITPTDFHNRSGLIMDTIAIAPTSISKAIAKFFIPSVLCSNPIPLNIFPSPFVILLKLFISFGRLSVNVETVWAALSKISPKPLIGAVKFSKMLRTFLPNIDAPIPVKIANILSHLSFPFSSER